MNESPADRAQPSTRCPVCGEEKLIQTLMLAGKVMWRGCADCDKQLAEWYRKGYKRTPLTGA